MNLKHRQLAHSADNATTIDNVDTADSATPPTTLPPSTAPSTAHPRRRQGRSSTTHSNTTTQNKTRMTNATIPVELPEDTGFTD